MLEEKLFEIFKRMSATEYISAERLAKAVGVSEKTIRTRLCILDDWLQQNQAALISKPRYGYRIITGNYDELYHRLLQEQESSQGIPDNLQERVQYVLLYLLCQTNYVKSEDLIDFLYISKGTLSGVLKQVEQILNNYRLRLDRRPNYGIKIIGREFDIRNCMLEYFVKRSLIDIEQEKQKADIEKIAILVEELLGKYDVHLSEIAYENIVLVLYITLERIKRDHPVESLEGQQQYADKMTQESLMLKEIINKMEMDYSVSFAKEEHDYLLLHLMSKQTTNGADQEEASIVISEEISNLVDGMLEFIRQETMYDFYSDFEVQMLLKQHMVKMDIRLRYRIFLDNPMLEEMKENHSIAYTIATLATTVLKDYYKTDISEEETGYLALIFLLGLERKQIEEKQKLNILIVCVSGKGSSQLLKYKYMHRFHDYIQEIYTCDMLELKEFNLEKINFVFTTVPIPWEISKPVVEIGLFLYEKEVPKILKVLKQQQQIVWELYFSEKGFCDSLKAEKKEDALKELCRYAQGQEGIEEDLFSSVLERESYGSTDFGNLIAVPHPNKVMVDYTRVYVAVLEKPVKWERQEVQIIFLTLIGRNADKNLPKFYEEFLDFLMDKEKIRRLIQIKRYDVLIQLLEK